MLSDDERDELVRRAALPGRRADRARIVLACAEGMLRRSAGPKAERVLEEADRAQLIRWARRAKTSQYLALGAKIVLACAEGGMNRQTATDLGWMSPPWIAGGPGSSPCVLPFAMR